MMIVLVAIALKSLIVAGATLVLLALTKRRSAAERSWVAHVGLLALVLLAVAPLALPSLPVAAPALAGEPATVETNVGVWQAPSTEGTAEAAEPAAAVATSALLPDPAKLAAALYAVPAVLLLLITFLALGRLLLLRARADVVVDGRWLGALARAQRRMGFKHGTALLTSDELSSPISWGLMRPVILLNSRAVEATGEAEAIIAHELAHVARLDWVKLLLARVATAIFWFNPLVWILAREAHHLREEAADDAVLGSDIADTDYAQLLVGVARHECSSLLIGAHGVAPSKSSLARRIARVLDSASPRGPVARPFALGVFVGGVALAAPLAAVTLTDHAAEVVHSDLTLSQGRSDVPHLIADGVVASVSHAAAALGSSAALQTGADGDPHESRGERRGTADEPVASRDALDLAIRMKAVGVTPEYAREMGAAVPHHTPFDADDLIEMKAVGLTPGYVASMRAAAPHLSPLDKLVTLKAVGVTPAYIRELAAAGFPKLTADQLIEARAVGVTGDDVRALVAAGYRAPFHKYVEARALGLAPGQVQSLRIEGPNGSIVTRSVTVPSPRNAGDWPPQSPQDPKPPADPPPPPGGY